MTNVATQQKIAPFLWFEDGRAEEAARFYVSVFKNSRLENVSRYSEVGPGPAGSPMVVEFQLEGQDFKAINAPSGDSPATDESVESFHHGAVALYIDCDTQEEVDRLWDALSAGGAKLPCGWVKDRFGFAWNIVPAGLGDLLGGDDPEASQRAMRAMLQMQKLDINELQRAYEGR
jgi:predicted 3-demethylubiquinone-9 3-methyltransferase (glyoxalase superfamily)